MRISREADYSLRILLLLGQNQSLKLSAGEIAARMRVPERFNLKILRKLTLAGLMHSYRGVYGGFSLAMAPEDINLLLIIEALEGTVFLNRCLKNPDECSLNYAGQCPIHASLYQINESLREQFRAVSLAYLLAQAEPMPAP